jgi:hypothetical protein
MAQRKETKTKVKVRDLKPKNDAKGGVAADVSTQVQQQNHTVQRRSTQAHSMNRWI